MISQSVLEKILFFDLETTGEVATLDQLDERKAALWHKRCDLLRSKYPETNAELTDEQMWEEKAGLHPEFGRIVCASYGYIKEGEMKLTSYYGEDEVDILEKSKKLISNVGSKGYSLCGHTVKRFDVPYLGKRLMMKGICPPDLLNMYNKKPWEINVIDIAEVWSFGSWQEGFVGLDTMCAVFDVESPKTDMHGSRVHDQFYKGNIEKIKTYCENDVRATIEVFQKFCMLP